MDDHYAIAGEVEGGADAGMGGTKQAVLASVDPPVERKAPSA